MVQIVMTATPYCYGPTSKLLCVAEDLARSHEVTYVGMEPGLSLAKKAAFVRVVEIQNRDSWNKTACGALARASCLATFLDYRSLKIAARLGVPSVFFDTLSWLRLEPPPFAKLAAAYVAQNYLQPPAAKLKEAIAPLLTVGPVFSRHLDRLSTNVSLGKRPRVIVHFGGLRSPVMRPMADRAYVSWIMSIIRRSEIDPSWLTVCLPVYLSRQAETLCAGLPKARIESPGIADFHAFLRDATVILTVPGLEAVLESMFVGVPLVFLPPHNGTQVLQLRDYQHYGVGVVYLVPPYLSALDVSTKDTSRLTAEVQRLNGRSANDGDLCRTLSCILHEAVFAIHENQSQSQSIVNRNRQLVRDLGTAGRQATVQIIRSHANHGGGWRGPKDI